MKFCPKCGMRLALSRKTMNNGIWSFLICPKCSYERTATAEESTVLRVIEHPSAEQIAVIDKKSANLRTMPTTRIECPKCRNHEAFWWMVQTRGADESSTQFFRCTKCNYTWREMT